MSGSTIYEMGNSEREVLLYYLNGMRNAVVRVSEGLTEEQQRAAGVASGTSLLGIIHHLTGVERHWFQLVFLGEEQDIDKTMQVPDGRTRDEVVAAYRQVCARSDEIVRATPELSTVAAIANPGESEKDTLRVIMTHLLRETARHAGHADILREQLDGATGL